MRKLFNYFYKLINYLLLVNVIIYMFVYIFAGGALHGNKEGGKYYLSNGSYPDGKHYVSPETYCFVLGQELSIGSMIFITVILSLFYESKNVFTDKVDEIKDDIPTDTEKNIEIPQQLPNSNTYRFPDSIEDANGNLAVKK